jgi:hypothetical protein
MLLGWNLDFPNYTSMRNYLNYKFPHSQWRNYPEGTTVQGRGVPLTEWAYELGGPEHPASAAGFDRLAFDFWTDQPNAVSLFSRSLLGHDDTFPGVCRRNSPWLIYAGPEGPVPTIRYEMLREGLQEREARIVIEKALLNHQDQLTPDLLSDCRTIISERLAVLSNYGQWYPWGGRGDHAEPNMRQRRPC